MYSVKPAKSTAIESYETDVAIVGAGGAGTAAALSAWESGANVLVIEKTAKVGGMLERDDLNIETISERCGFNDCNYFRTCFKKLTGASPSVYREIHKYIAEK